MIGDPGVPEVAILLGPRAREPLETVTRARGEELSGFEIRQIVYRPDRRIAVVYEIRTAAGGVLAVVLAAGEIPDGAALIESESGALGAWIFPNDPELPGLRSLFRPHSLASLLSDLGVESDRTAAITRSYRPGKRAVVEVVGTSRRLFVKAVRPGEVSSLQEAHVALSPHVPIPSSHGWSPVDGLVVLEALPGRPLFDDPAAAPHPRVIENLLDRIPPIDRPVTPRTRRIGSHLRLLSRIAPHVEDALGRVAAAVRDISPARESPVHGDLHSGQILVQDGRLTGLVDIDTVGIGERADDWANLIAHLHIVALGDPSGAAADYGQRVFQHVIRSHDERDLRLRIAATMLGYAPGPWLRQTGGWPALIEGRVGAALAWLPA